MKYNQQPGKDLLPNSNRSTPTIGLLVSSLESKYENKLVRGITDALQPSGANLICFTGAALPLPLDLEAQRNLFYNMVSPENVDGLIISGILIHTMKVEEIMALCQHYHPLPMVAVALDLPGIPSIMIDNYQGMRNVLVHLVESHACHRIAYIRGPQGQPEAEERYRAYCDVLAEYNIPFDANLVSEGAYARLSGKAAMERLLDRQHLQFDALAAASDAMLLGALDVLQARGIQVPIDIAVAGFDDTEDSRYHLPPITTARQSTYEQGWQAAEMLLSLLAGRPVPERVTVPVDLVVRESCGCPNLVVEQAWADLTVTTAEDDADIYHRELVCAEIRQSIQIARPDLFSKWVEDLFDTFSADLKTERPQRFLVTLRAILHQNITYRDNVAGWQTVLSILRCRMLPFLNSGSTLQKAENLWQQARILVSNAVEQRQDHLRMEAEQQARSLREISKLLATTLDLPELLELMAEKFPQLGIRSCYLALYENPDSLTNWSRLILAYDERGRIPLAAQGKRFLSGQLIPGGTSTSWQERSFVVEALYSGGKQLGVLLMEVDLPNLMICESVRGQLSNVLQSIFLLQAHRQAETEIRKIAQANEEEAYRLKLLNDMGAALGSTTDVEQIFKVAAAKAKQIIGGDRASITLLNADEDRLEFYALDGHQSVIPMNTQIPVEETSAAIAIQEKRVINLPNLQESDRLFTLKTAEQGMRSALFAPLLTRGKVLGTLNVLSRQLHAYHEREENLINQMASLLAATIESRRLFEQTQQRTVELEEMTSFLNSIIQNIPSMVFVKEVKELRFVHFNKAAEALIGLKEAEVVGKNDYDFFPPDRAEELCALEREVLKKGDLIDIPEEVIGTVTGDLRLLHTRKLPIFGSDGEPKYLLGISEDITERKCLEQQIQESLERRGRQVQTSTEIAQEIAAAPALDDLFHRVVSLVQERFNYYYAQLYIIEDVSSTSSEKSSKGRYLVMQEGTGEMGRQIKAGGHKIALASEKSLVARSARTGESILVPNVVEEPNWLPNPFLPETRSEVAVPIRLGNEILGVLDVQNDTVNGLTAEDQLLLAGLCGQIAVVIDYRRAEVKRQQAEQELQRYAAKLEQSNRELENFAYIASHDLQEPLRKIQTFGDRLKSKYGDLLGEQGQDYLNRMHNAAARMQNLIQDLLTFSRITTRAQPFRPINLNTIVQEVLSDLEIAVEEVGGRIELGELPIIEGDPTQMRQLFQNLIGNALKFHRKEELLVVKIHSRPLSENFLGRKLYQISVEDNGIGFEEKYGERIFGVFQRLHNRQEYTGTGVGLAICRKVVEQHGGTITARSVPGCGTTFIVTLPVEQSKEHSY